MAIYISLTLCAIIAGLLVYRYDMYEREPLHMLILVAALGVGAGWSVGHLEDLTIGALGERAESNAGLAAIAASHEEAAKLLIVLFIALCFRRQFNDPMDGIIYGSFAGLGMAVEEAIFYMRLSETEVFEGHVPVRLMMHTLMGGLDGFALGMWRMRMRRWPAALVGCVAASLTLHFLWDVVSMSASQAANTQAWHTASAVGLLLATVLTFGWLVVVAGRWSRETFGGPGPQRLWSWPFSLLFRKRG